MSEHWTAALWTLGAGLGVGVVGSLAVAKGRLAAAPEGAKREKGKKKAAPAAPVATGDRLDLIARRDQALFRLKELDQGVPPDSENERATLELTAARAMRDLAQIETQAPAAAAAPAGGILSHRWVWAIGSSAFTIAIVLGLQSFTAPREAGRSMTGGTAGGMNAAPAGPMAGGGEAQHPTTPPAQDPTVAALEARLEKDPDNINLHLDLADAYLGTETGAVQAFQHAKYVLAREPENPRALTQQAAVRSMMGMQQAAFDAADLATRKDPKLVMAWVVRGRAALMLGQRDVGEKSFAKAIALAPEAESFLKQELNSAGAPVARGQGEDAPAPAPAAAAAGPAITGTIELDPSVGQPAAGAFVFVLARDASGSPMPVAAKRFPAAGFPISFTLGKEDAVMGRPIPDKVLLEARLDADGNATTKNPTDPIARQDQVALGTSGLRLVLRAP